MASSVTERKGAWDARTATAAGFKHNNLRLELGWHVCASAEAIQRLQFTFLSALSHLLSACRPTAHCGRFHKALRSFGSDMTIHAVYRELSLVIGLYFIFIQ